MLMLDMYDTDVLWSFPYTQVFSYTANKEIRTDDLCLDVSKLNGPVMMLKCHHLKGNQLWEYDPVVSVKMLQITKSHLQ